MDAHSEAFLAHVHPDLAAVMRAAGQEAPFAICYGVRSLEAEAEAVRTGHSQTMHSRHLASKTPAYLGLACAVDVARRDPATSKIDWAPGHEQAVFGAIAVNVLAAARLLGKHVRWGGSWAEDTVVKPGHFHDWGHFELPWSLYP